MKILYVSQYFPPEMGAPAARVSEMSKEWVRCGHQVTVLTGFPNHPTGVIPPEYRGEIIRREQHDGVSVIRVPIFAAPNRGYSGRIANYTSFAVTASVLGPLLAERPDVVVATSPQFLVAVAGRFLAWAKRPWRSIPFVFEVRDIWPQSIVEVGAMSAESHLVRMLERIERWLYRTADKIVVVTEGFVSDIAKKGVARNKLAVIKNGVDTSFFSPAEKQAARVKLDLPSDKFIATYVGTHGMAHGLGFVLDAANLMRKDGILFHFVGDGAEKSALVARAKETKLPNTLFWDSRPRTDVPQILAASDLALVTLRDLPSFRTTIPSKIFEIMGMGRPMLITVDGEARHIVETANSGVFCPPESPRDLVRCLRELKADHESLRDKGESGRRFAVQNCSRAALAQRYLDLLQEVASRR